MIQYFKSEGNKFPQASMMLKGNTWVNYIEIEMNMNAEYTKLFDVKVQKNHTQRKITKDRLIYRYI